MLRFQRPTSLKPGDKIAIISPSAGLPFLFPWVYEQGIARVRDIFGLEPIEFPTARKSPDYLRQNPKARADDINAAFADPSIKGMIATIGGDDQIKILPYLDLAAIQANPKIFMGYSDCTNLHLILWNLKIISYYGGAIMTQFAMNGGMHAYTIDSIKKALFSPKIGPVFAAPEYTDVDLEWADPTNLSKSKPMYPSQSWSWHNNSSQIIEGRLWGGCLESLAMHLELNHYLPPPDQLEQAVLFLETSEELPSDVFVYRFFTKLAEMNLLHKFQAILMGYPKAQFCEQQPPEGKEVFIANQQKAVKRALQNLKTPLPVVFNMNFGHTDPQLIIPNGGLVRIDCKKQSIEF